VELIKTVDQILPCLVSVKLNLSISDTKVFIFLFKKSELVVEWGFNFNLSHCFDLKKSLSVLIFNVLEVGFSISIGRIDGSKSSTLIS
jgi:hypothetical protein